MLQYHFCVKRSVMRRLLVAFLLLSFAALFAACNPAYAPVPATGILESDEVEFGGYASFGYLGNKVRPTTFRGVLANFGVFVRKGVADGVDATGTLSTYGVTGAWGFAQDKEAETVLRACVGLGWMNAMMGVDWATRVSEGPRTHYNVGGSATAWIGDAFFTDDPGLSYGLRVGPLFQIAAEPRWDATTSGGVRFDWAPLQFGGKGSAETLLDLIGGSRNPYEEPYDEGLPGDWPRPIFAFEPGAWAVTGGPAISYHSNRGQWLLGGEKEKD